MNKITACLIIYNEEAYIQKALDSLKTCVDEIIVVHDGPCDDRSLEIAKKYTDKVFIRKRYGIPEMHFKFAFSQAKHNWILKLDADEFLSKELQENLKNIINSKLAFSYFFLWTDYNQKKDKVLSNKGRYKPFLFYKLKMVSVGILHFTIISKGKSTKLDYHVYHCYKSFKFNINKNKKWAKIHAKQLVYDDYSCFQGDKSDYNLGKGHNLFIKYPLSFGILRAFYNIFKIIINEKLYYLNPIRACKIILNNFLYNIYLVRSIYIIKKNK
jgi:glycosyltransferase involved in cell wall biosynthesis